MEMTGKIGLTEVNLDDHLAKNIPYEEFYTISSTTIFNADNNPLQKYQPSLNDGNNKNFFVIPVIGSLKTINSINRKANPVHKKKNLIGTYPIKITKLLFTPLIPLNKGQYQLSMKPVALMNLGKLVHLTCPVLHLMSKLWTQI